MSEKFYTVTSEYARRLFYEGFNAEKTLNKHKMAEKLNKVIIEECFGNFKRFSKVLPQAMKINDLIPH